MLNPQCLLCLVFLFFIFAKRRCFYIFFYLFPCCLFVFCLFCLFVLAWKKTFFICLPFVCLFLIFFYLSFFVFTWRRYCGSWTASSPTPTLAAEQTSLSASWIKTLIWNISRIDILPYIYKEKLEKFGNISASLTDNFFVISCVYLWQGNCWTEETICLILLNASVLFS